MPLTSLTQPDKQVTTVLVTGAAGFIGFHISKYLLSLNYNIVGIDNLNDYYDPALKENRLNELKKHAGFYFINADISQFGHMDLIKDKGPFKYIIHLAAQAGVRYSRINPHAYASSNLMGFFNVIEFARIAGVEHFIYASSSSVYGLSKPPFLEINDANSPLSLYAATKKANEMIAHAYSYNHNLPCTGLRFFTVYGPWGRPDMAPLKFAKAILKGEEVKLHANGEMLRDFTYIDDVVRAIGLICRIPPLNTNASEISKNPLQTNVPWRVLNVGNGSPITVRYFLYLIEKELGLSAKTINVAIDQGEVWATDCDSTSLDDLIGKHTPTAIESGIAAMCKWLIEHDYVNRYVN